MKDSLHPSLAAKFPACLLCLLSLCLALFACGDTGGVPKRPTTAERPADGMTMIQIPAGEFLMGSDESAYQVERPGHTVHLDEYWIDRTEVSNAQYRLCAEAGACSESRSWTSAELNGDDQPALVAWDSARTYCEWVGARLPTEAEWEKAARGTDGRLFPWGNEWQETWANVSSEIDGYKTTSPVGSFPDGASPYGLLDMAGNAAEWVADLWSADYYTRSPAENPTGPARGDQHVYRSAPGNAGGGPDTVRVIARHTARSNWETGFRCAASQEPGE